tara:strand:+ start:102 stop:476 length:375 start_codon:yes stop_codon:yes gene_type:complete
MASNQPLKSAKEFNMNTIKKGKDKKTEYIVKKKINGIKYWKILKPVEKKCLKDFEKKKKVNLSEYKKGKYVSNKQALAVTYSQVFKAEPKCKKYIGKNTETKKSSVNKSKTAKSKKPKTKKVKK